MNVTNKHETHWSTVLALATLAAFSPAARPAAAQAVVVPNSLATVQGGGNLSTAPFNNVSRYQQIYAASQFSAVGGSVTITQIAFRPANSQTTAFSHTIPSIQFDLSTTPVTVSQLSTTFAANVGANDAVVYNGPLTLSSANVSGPGTSKQFDILVNLPTPFLYNPSAGSLLLDIRNFSSGFSGYVDSTPDDSATPATRLNFVDNSTTAATGTVQTAGAVTRFTFASAPEPSASAALGLSILGVGALALRARRRTDEAA